MGNIYVNECANNTESQNWFVNADGRIALVASNQSKSNADGRKTPKPLDLELSNAGEVWTVQN